MNLAINEKLIIVGGASSGLGKAVALALLQEGARVIGVARNNEKLNELSNQFPNQFEPLICDITRPEAIDVMEACIGNRDLYGILINAGGPPAKTVIETKIEDWDDAYYKVLRWKVDLTKRLLLRMERNGQGRFLFIESASVKQPMENLVLSNAFRVAVVAFVKTLSQEAGGRGVTFNVLAPGSHATPAYQRVVDKKMEQTGQSREQIVNQLVKQNTVGRLGSPDDFASLACWLFSPYSRFINGQTITVDGGSVKGLMG